MGWIHWIRQAVTDSRAFNLILSARFGRSLQLRSLQTIVRGAKISLSTSHYS